MFPVPLPIGTAADGTRLPKSSPINLKYPKRMIVNVDSENKSLLGVREFARVAHFLSGEEQPSSTSLAKRRQEADQVHQQQFMDPLTNRSGNDPPNTSLKEEKHMMHAELYQNPRSVGESQRFQCAVKCARSVRFTIENILRKRVS